MKLNDNDILNIIKLSGCIYASMDALKTLKGRVYQIAKKKLNNFEAYGESFLTSVQKAMTEKQKEDFEKYSAYSHEVLNEAFKAKDKNILLQLLKAYNRGEVGIINEEEKPSESA